MRDGRQQQSVRTPMRRAKIARFVVVLRALLVCLALQMSGLVHFALDLWLHGDAAAEHFSEHPEDDDSDCPPGCTSCHCVHGTAALPAPDSPESSILLPAFEVAWAPYEAGTPPSLAPPSVYRPPRA